MLSTLLLISLLAGQGAKPATAALPDTPQGRHVEAYIKAFNSGDEKTFLAANEKLMAPELQAKRSAEERAKLFQRMRSDFGTLKVHRVLGATPAQISFVMILEGGDEGTFTFDFEEKAPFKIQGLGIDVEKR
jgi:urease alpha subunit